MSTIELKNKNEARSFVWGDMEGFTEVETVKDLDELYQDSCPATTVCKQESTGKYYALDWTSYESHYGSGESEYDDTVLYEVELQEKTVVVKEWVAVKETTKE